MSTISAGTTSTTTLIHSGDTTGSLVLKTNDTGSGGTTAMTIDTSQNVGIGTSSPAFKLEVVGATNNGIHIKDAASATVYGGLFTQAASLALYARSNHALNFGTNDTERMRIDSSGNVGIGTSSPSGKLDVATDSNTTAYLTYARNANAGSSAYAISGWGNNSSANAGQVAISSTANTGYGGGGDFIFLANTGDMTLRTTTAKPMTFYTNASERMRIDSSGNVGIGLAPSYRLSVLDSAAGARVVDIQNTASTGNPIMQYSTMTVTGTTSNYFFVGRANASDRIYIYGSGNIVNVNNSYGALSDVKLKENIIDATPKLADLMRVKVRNYNLIGETQKQIGVVAQELEQVFPSMVDETIDRDAEGNELETTTKSVKYSVFVPMLIKAIQEQQALIQALTDRITALEGK